MGGACDICASRRRNEFLRRNDTKKRLVLRLVLRSSKKRLVRGEIHIYSAEECFQTNDSQILFYKMPYLISNPILKVNYFL